MTRYLIPPTPAEDLPPPPPMAQDFNIPDEAFGARTAFGALDPGEQLEPGYWDEANRANSTRVAELQNQFLDRQREILHTGPDAYLNKTGRDAVLGAPDALAQLEAARQDTISQAANEAQRRQLQTALGEHAITEHYRVGTHAGEQSLEWQKQTATERLNQLRQQAALDYSDPGSIEAYGRASESAARERARTMKFGTDSSEAQAEVDGARSSIWRSAIEAALSKRDIKPAIALHTQAMDRLSPEDAAALGLQIRAAHEHDIAREYVSSIAPTDPPQTIPDIDDAHEEASAQNDDDWGHDPELHATIQHFIDMLFGGFRQNVWREESDRDAALRDWLGKSGSDGQPQTALPPPSIWAELDPARQQAVREVLKRNALGGGKDSFILAAGNPDEPPEEEYLRKFLHHQKSLDDAKQIQPHQILPLAPPAAGGILGPSRGSRAPAPLAKGRAQPGSGSKPVEKAFPRIRQTVAELFAATRERLKQLKADHLQVLREVPSPIDKDLKGIRDAYGSELLRKHAPLGRAFEDRVRQHMGWAKNKDKVSGEEGISIPDVLTADELIEIKGRAYVTMNKQLRIQSDWARKNGRKAKIGR